MHRATLVVTVLAVVVMALSLGCGMGSSAPKATLEKFMECGKAQDWDGMVDLMYFGDEQIKQMGKAEAEVRKMIADSMKNAAKTDKGSVLLSYTISDEKKVSDTESTFSVKTKEKEGGKEKEETKTVSVVQSKGKWYVKF